MVSSAFADGDSTESNPPAETLNFEEAVTPEVRAEVRDQLDAQEQLQDELTDLANEAVKDDVGPNAAKQLLEELFGAQLNAVPDPLGAVDVVRFVSDNAAVVEVDGLEDPILLESSTPLRVDTGSGKAPLDLSLEGQNGEFAPETSETEVGLSRDLDEGLAVGGVELSFPDANPSAPASLTSDDEAAFYPEISEDTDLLVAPTPNGIETFTQLRTPQSPTSQRVELGLPAGSVLQSKDGGAKVTKNGQVVMSVSAPTAVDAAGESVPVEMSVDGDALVISATPGADATYPILVDPVYETYNWWFGNTTAGMTDWQGRLTPPDGIWNRYVTPFAGSFLGLPPALWVFGSAGFYKQGASTNWNYDVPRFASDMTTYGSRPTSYIASVNMAMNGGNNGDTSTGMFMYGGIGDTDTPAIVDLGGYPTNSTPATYAPTSTNQAGKSVAFGLIPFWGATAITQTRFAYMPYVDIGLGDTGAPTVNSVTVPKEWSSTTPPTITVNSTDTGLGVQKVTLKRNGPGTAPIDYFSSCAATVSSPCPRNKVTTMSSSYDYTSLSEGTHTFEVKAHDPLNVSTAKPLTLKIDRTNPDLNATGTLVNTSNPLIGAYPKVDIDADDARSGVERVVLKLDGIVVDEVTQACPGGACSIDEEVQFDLSGKSAGSHTFQLVAVDFAGNTDAISGTLVLDPVAPTISGTGDLFDYDGQPLPTASASASLSASDSGTGNTGIARFETTVNDGTPIVDNKTCSPNCPASATSSYTYTKSAWPTGGNMVEFAAVDKAGNKNYVSVWVDVPEEQPVDLMCDGTTPTVLTSGDDLSSEDALDAIETDFPSAVAPSSAYYDGAAVATWNPTLVPAATGTTPPDVDVEMAQTFAEGEAGVLPASGFTIGDQTCMTPAQTTADETEGEIVNGDSILYANSATDTDTVVRPTPLGAVVIQHLRSDDSPTTFAWDVSVEDGQELVELDSGGIAVVYSDSESSVGPNEVLVEPDRDEISDLSDSQTQFEGSYWDIEKAEQETGKEVVSVLSPPIARTAANEWVAAELQKIAAAKVALELASAPDPGDPIAVAYSGATPLAYGGSGGIGPDSGPALKNQWTSYRACGKYQTCLFTGIQFSGEIFVIADRDVWFDLFVNPNHSREVRSITNGALRHGLFVSKKPKRTSSPSYCVKAGKAEVNLRTKPNLFTNIEHARIYSDHPNEC